MTKIGKGSDKKVFFLDGYEGAYRSGAFYRSKASFDVHEFETKFKVKVVGIVLEMDDENPDKPSFNIEFYTEVNKESAISPLELTKREENLIEEAKYLEDKADIAIENAIKEGRDFNE